MTSKEREEAIAFFEKRIKCREILESQRGCKHSCWSCEYDTKITRIDLKKIDEAAVEALKQEPCEDVVSRKEIMEKLKSISSATPTREHGEWRETGDVILWHKGILLFECQCSKCKGLAHFRKESLEHKLVGADWCPCCGADMRKE